jgi:thermitase
VGHSRHVSLMFLIASSFILTAWSSDTYGFNDPIIKWQTALKTINAFNAYKILLTGPYALTDTVKIGIIDQGHVNPLHPDLTGQLLEGSDTSTKSRKVKHGQYVLGIMAAKAGNGIGTAGIAGMRAQFLYKSLPLLERKKDGGMVDMLKLAEMLYAMGEAGIDVVNISLGIIRRCSSKFGKCSRPIVADPTVLKAIKETSAKFGTLFVVAAGNDSDEVPVYSTINDGVIVVGAVNESKERSKYSNYGPGVNLSATDSGVFGLSFNSYANHESFENGTSYTAPQVTAAAALIKGYLRQNGTLLSAPDLAELILRSAKNSQLDFGRAAQEAQKLLGADR